MTQSPDTLANIGLAFTGELTERENRLRAELTQALGKIAELITSGFDGIRKDIAELKESDRQLLSGLQNLQGQVTAMQRAPKG
jgi:FtsZ-binding cell division protein ZapB